MCMWMTWYNFLAMVLLYWTDLQMAAMHKQAEKKVTAGEQTYRIQVTAFSEFWFCQSFMMKEMYLTCMTSQGYMQ